MNRDKKTITKELLGLIAARNFQEEKIKQIKKKSPGYTFLYLALGLAVGAAAAQNLVKFAFSAIGEIPDFYPKTLIYGTGLIFMAIWYFFARGLEAFHDSKINASLREIEKVVQSLSESINECSKKLNELEDSYVDK